MPISLIGLINSLSLKDRGSRQVAAGVRYGGGARHRLDVYAPKTNRGPVPVIVYYHGGGWDSGDPENYEFIGRSLAALGYVVAMPAYGLLPEVEYPVFLQDCAEAARFVVEHAGDWGGDAHRVALGGHSAGAYNAAMVALDRDLRARAGLGENLKGVACLSGPFDFFPFDGPISIRTFGAVRHPERTQPVNHVSSAAPPFFLGQGGRDPLVYPKNTIALAARLREAGVAVDEHHYPKLEHAMPMLALGRPLRFLAPVRAQLSDFFAKVLA